MFFSLLLFNEYLGLTGENGMVKILFNKLLSGIAKLCLIMGALLSKTEVVRKISDYAYSEEKAIYFMKHMLNFVLNLSALFRASN